jgi:hypothetical protein
MARIAADFCFSFGILLKLLDKKAARLDHNKKKMAFSLFKKRMVRFLFSLL